MIFTQCFIHFVLVHAAFTRPLFVAVSALAGIWVTFSIVNHICPKQSFSTATFVFVIFRSVESGVSLYTFHLKEKGFKIS